MRRTHILVIALALVFAACSTDSSTSGSDEPTTTSIEAEHSDEAAHDEAAPGDEMQSMDGMEEESPEGGDGHSEDDHSNDGDMAGMFVSEENFPEATGEVVAEYTIEMGEFTFEHSGFEIEPGSTVRFVFINSGLLGHEFRLTTGHKADEHVAAGHADHGDEAAHHEDADIIVNVAPGETRTVEMTIPHHAEIDRIACLIPGHYEAGMYLDI